MHFLQMSNRENSWASKLIDFKHGSLQRDDDYPNVAKPVIVEMETHRGMAVSIGTANTA